jgi:hypothetical protein
VALKLEGFLVLEMVLEKADSIFSIFELLSYFNPTSQKA